MKTDWSTYEKLVIESAYSLKEKYIITNIASSLLIAIRSFVFGFSFTAIFMFIVLTGLNQLTIFLLKRKTSRLIRDIIDGDLGKEIRKKNQQRNGEKDRDSQSYYEYEIKELFASFKTYLVIGVIILEAFSKFTSKSFFIPYVLSTIIVGIILYNTSSKKERLLREKRDNLVHDPFYL